MNSQHPEKSLQHEEKMSMKERIEQSRVYGEEFRASHAGADQREAVKPLAAHKPDDRPMTLAEQDDETRGDDF